MESDCTEENRTEDFCTEGNCTEENNPPEVEFFITQMAFGLIQGMMSPEDIYEGMLEANEGNKDVARYICDRAVREANLFLDSTNQHHRKAS